jgi:hypothetical protein
MERAPRSYSEFWPYYVSQHRKTSTRVWHFVGTLFVFASLTAAVLVSPLWILGAFIGGYGPAWIGHFFFEKNRPATFTYPFWSLVGDFQMFFTTVMGRMGAEIERAERLYPPGGSQGRPLTA